MNTTTKNIIALVLFTIFTVQSSFATIYSTIKNGNYNTNNTWSPSKPNMIWGFNDTVIINHQISFNSSISVFGHFIISNTGSINANSRTLSVKNNASFINEGIVSVNKMIGNFNHNGITNNSIINLKSSFLNKEGTVTNNGTMNIEGVFTNSYNGITYNNGTLNVDNNFINHNKFYGNGNLNVGGSLTNNSGSKFIYDGNVVVEVNLKNKGKTIIGGNVEVNGDIINFWLSKLTFNDTTNIAGNISTNGPFTSNSTLNANNLTSQAKINLNGITTINGNIINRSNIDNSGALTVIGNYKNRIANKLNNSGTINIKGNILNKGEINNTAIIIIDGNLDNDDYIEVSNGAVLYVKSNLDNAYIIDNNGNIYVDSAVIGNGDIDGIGILCHSNGTTDPTDGAKGNDINCEICGDLAGTLPVQLISFNAYQSNSNITISWTTANEENNDYFEVLRSIDGKNFKIIAEVGGAGNSNITLDYSIIDSEVDNNTYYYMLKQTDYDNKFTVSEMIAVTINSELNTKVYPNPITQGETLNIEFESLNSNQVSIYDINGRNIKTIQTSSINETLDISDLASGIYMLQIQSGSQVKVEKLIVK